MSEKKENSKKKNEILAGYSKLRKSQGRDLSMEDILSSTEYTKDMIKHHWGSIGKLDEFARKKYPTRFIDIKIEKIISPKKLQKLTSTISKYKKFFITTAVTGCDVHTGFYNSIKTWEKKNNGKILILISSDPAHNLDKGSLGRVPKVLANENIIIEDTELNSNVFLSTIKLSAKQIDPITGMNRVGQRNGSFMFASPKQRLKSVPVYNNKLPHFLMTTGAITKPDYSSANFMSNRTAYIADNDHVVGGIIVEVIDDQIFHFRQVQADGNGDFIDVGVKYSSTTTKKIDAAAAIIEWHSGETDPTAKACFKEMCSVFKPKYIVVHDVFNGTSINHHAEKNIIYRASVVAKKIDLKHELKVLAADIDELHSWTNDGEIIIPKSNHDEWLTHYLQKAKYAEDPINHGIGLKLADKMVNDGETDPLKWGVENIAGLKKARVTWLSRDEDFTVGGVQLGAHGDKGANGTRGSLKAMENAYGNSVTGHAHSPEILRGAWQIGTLTHLKLEYNQGPSSWFNSVCFVYPNGARQMVNIVEGKWRA